MIILVRPHHSYWDGFVVAWWLTRMRGMHHAVFAVDSDFARHPVWSMLLRLYGKWVGGHKLVALDSRKPFAMRTLLKQLRENGAVVIFPQGTGLAQGPDRPDQPGWQWLAKKTGVAVGEFEIAYSGWSAKLEVKRDPPKPALICVTSFADSNVAKSRETVPGCGKTV